MEPTAVQLHSYEQAKRSATLLWSLSSSQYPLHHPALLDTAAEVVIETATIFAVNLRRVLEVADVPQRLVLDQPRWEWEPTTDAARVGTLREALNRIIHAQQLQVGFVSLPLELSAIEGGAVVIPYLSLATDRHPEALVDLFSMAHAALYKTTIFPVAARSPNGAN